MIPDSTDAPRSVRFGTVLQEHPAYADFGDERGGVRSIVRCRSCGERIGIYERLTYELPDRTLVPSGLLGLSDDVKRLGDRVRYFHAACSPPWLRAVED
jgi:hypothetical protein